MCARDALHGRYKREDRTDLRISINRGSQYGKTTTIARLKKRLPDDYICANISFENSSGGKLFTGAHRQNTPQ